MDNLCSRRLVIVTLMLFAASTISAEAAAQRTGGRMGGRGAMRGDGNRPGREIREFAARIQTRDYLFPETSERLTYNVFVSSRVDAKKPSPLVIVLHGLGARPEAVIRMVGGEADNRGYILAAPMGYNLQGWYGANGLTSERRNPRNLGELSEKDVLHVLEIMRKDFNIDERRIYLLGQSMGGAGALHLGIKYAQIWAAVGASAPALRSSQTPLQLESVKQLPMMLVHGDQDRAVPVEQTRVWAAKMKELGMTFEYYEIRGAGHSDALPTGADRVFNFFGKHKKPAG